MEQVLASLCCWIGFVIESTNLWNNASDDALVDAVLLKGPKRFRRIDPVLQSAVAKLAGQGDMARTGAQAWQMAVRMRRWVVPRQGCSTGNEFMKSRLAAYYEAVVSVASQEQIRIVAVSMDASRMGRKDCCYLAGWLPEVNLGFWFPPQAR